MSSLKSTSKTGLNDDNVIFAANESEVQLLDRQHRVINAAMPQLVLAPINLGDGGKRVLDQATGSGIWILDVREAIGPASNTWTGTDTEDSYFPKRSPAEASYHHQSITEAWPGAWLGSFDLVHSRMALPGVGLRPLETVVQNLISLLKPGSWIQLVEMEWHDWHAGPALITFRKAMRQLVSMVINGQGVDLKERLQEIFKQAGIVNVGFAVIKIPVGVEAKEEVRELSVQTMFATATFAVDTLKKLSAADVSIDLNSLPSELVSELGETGGAYNLFALWAQKPALD